MNATDLLFYSFATVATVSAVLVIFLSNPIYSALFLALSMSALGALFFMLEAYFVSVAQITVYAGAVMVLFVMVVMLFDLKHDQEEVLKISPINVVKLFSTALLCGFLVGTGWLAISAFSNNSSMQIAPQLKQSQMEKSGSVSTALSAAKKTEAEEASSGEAVPRPEDEDLTSAEEASLVDKPSVPVGGAVVAEEFGSTRALSKLLFTNYVFEFEAVSLLLLIAIVGAVALAKSKGGTHHASR